MKEDHMNTTLTGMVNYYSEMDELLYWKRDELPGSEAIHLKRDLKKVPLYSALIVQKDHLDPAEQSFVELMQFSLEELGHQVFIARNLQEAVNTMSTESLDVVIVDMSFYPKSTPGILRVIDNVIYNFGPPKSFGKTQLVPLNLTVRRRKSDTLTYSTSLKEMTEIFRKATWKSQRNDKRNPVPRSFLYSLHDVLVSSLGD